MKDYFKIGDVADLFRISVQTLRFYEREGLFVPEKIDRDSHYRYYSIHQLQLLQQIIFLRDLGLPLKTIRQQLEEPNAERYIRTLEALRDSLVQRIADDTSRLNFLEGKIGTLKASAELPQDEVVILKYPEQTIVRFDRPMRDAREHEEAMVEFLQTGHLMPGISRVGQLFAPNDYELPSGNAFASALYVFEEMCTDKTKEQRNLRKETLPGGTYAALLYQKHTEDSAPFIRRLLREAEEKGYACDGEVIRSIYYDVGDSDMAGSGYLACIRVRVNRKRS